MSDTVNCPLMGQEIDTGVCFDIHMFVEDGAPEWTVPETVARNKECKKICLQCPNHRED